MYKQSKKPVKPNQQVVVETESFEPNPKSFNWKEIVFGSNPAVTEDSNDENESNESEQHNTEESESEHKEESEKSESESEHKEEKSESEPDTDQVNEPIVFIADDADKPISIHDLQKQIQSKVTKPIVFDIGDNDKKELTVSEKLNKIMDLLETATIQLTNQANGYDTSTKILLEKINSNVLKSRIITNTPDTNFSSYEVKVDKLATRINELETNLKLFISTTIDVHKTSYNLKQCIIESEENLKNVLQQIYNKI
jgi:cobalamin biosynthesis protein CobT